MALNDPQMEVSGIPVMSCVLPDSGSHQSTSVCGVYPSHVAKVGLGAAGHLPTSQRPMPVFLDFQLTSVAERTFNTTDGSLPHLSLPLSGDGKHDFSVRFWSYCYASLKWKCFSHVPLLVNVQLTHAQRAHAVLTVEPVHEHHEVYRNQAVPVLFAPSCRWRWKRSSTKFAQ